MPYLDENGEEIDDPKPSSTPSVAPSSTLDRWGEGVDETVDRAGADALMRTRDYSYEPIPGLVITSSHPLSHVQQKEALKTGRVSGVPGVRAVRVFHEPEEYKAPSRSTGGDYLSEAEMAEGEAPEAPPTETINMAGVARDVASGAGRHLGRIARTALDLGAGGLLGISPDPAALASVLRLAGMNVPDGAERAIPTPTPTVEDINTYLGGRGAVPDEMQPQPGAERVGDMVGAGLAMAAGGGLARGAANRFFTLPGQTSAGALGQGTAQAVSAGTLTAASGAPQSEVGIAALLGGVGGAAGAGISRLREAARVAAATKKAEAATEKLREGLRVFQESRSAPARTALANERLGVTPKALRGGYDPVGGLKRAGINPDQAREDLARQVDDYVSGLRKKKGELLGADRVAASAKEVQSAVASLKRVGERAFEMGNKKLLKRTQAAHKALDDLFKPMFDKAGKKVRDAVIPQNLNPAQLDRVVRRVDEMIEETAGKGLAPLRKTLMGIRKELNTLLTKGDEALGSTNRDLRDLGRAQRTLSDARLKEAASAKPPSYSTPLKPEAPTPQEPSEVLTRALEVGTAALPWYLRPFARMATRQR